jgi:hypothetical protein
VVDGGTLRKSSKSTHGCKVCKEGKTHWEIDIVMTLLNKGLPELVTVGWGDSVNCKGMWPATAIVVSGLNCREMLGRACSWENISAPRKNLHWKGIAQTHDAGG